LGPADVLHGLYQTISPLLEIDPCFNSMLREKTAEALVRAPARLWELDLDAFSEDDIHASESTVDSTIGMISPPFIDANEDLFDEFLFSSSA
jgi:hypothetical protein